MGLDILASIIAALASLLGAGLYTTGLTQKAIEKLLRTVFGRRAAEKPYSVRLAELTENLTNASREVDAVLVELTRVAKNRAQTVQQLEVDVTAMEGREKDLKERITALQNTPVAVAEHFARLVEISERRSAMRDYLLFGAALCANRSETRFEG